MGTVHNRVFFARLIGTATLGLLISGCGTGSTSSGPPSVPQSALGPVSLLTTISVPNIPPATGAFAYDIGFVDPARHQYYLADRNNKSLDVVDTTTNSLIAQITNGPGGTFFGIGPTFGQSGPDGVTPVPGTTTVYVGDVNSVKVVDVDARSIVKNIPTGSAGFRSDEACYDPDDGLMMFANPNDPIPYVSFISTASQSVIAKLSFGSGGLAGTSGLEQCQYDAASKSFFINNDGTNTNPNGELDQITAASAVAGAPAVSKVIPLGNCSPAGLAQGPNENYLVGCDPSIGAPEISLIVNVNTGATKTITQVGGADEVWYNPGDNRWYEAARNMTASGISGPVRTPVLGIIDAGTLAWVQNVPTGKNAHSVAVDPGNNHVFVPIPSGIGVYGRIP
ncbi:MAG: hypothetical protein NVSMB64_12740 [Candidatus Velthaea sp.]